MAIDWTSVLTNIGSTSAALAIIGYIARSLLTHHLSRDLESFKANLQLSAERAQYRYAVLHEKRAEVLGRAYTLVVRVNRAAASYLSIVEFEGEPSKDEKWRVLAKRGNMLTHFFSEHRIFFDKTTCAKFDALLDAIRDPAQKFSFSSSLAAQTPENPAVASMKNETWMEGARSLKEEVPPLLEALEDDFRQILGVGESNGISSP